MSISAPTMISPSESLYWSSFSMLGSKDDEDEAFSTSPCLRNEPGRILFEVGLAPSVTSSADV